MKQELFHGVMIERTDKTPKQRAVLFTLIVDWEEKKSIPAHYVAFLSEEESEEFRTWLIGNVDYGNLGTYRKEDIDYWRLYFSPWSNAVEANIPPRFMHWFSKNQVTSFVESENRK